MPSKQPQPSSSERLLAKSSKGGDPLIVLQGHTGQVLQAADALLTEVADNLLRQLGLDATRWYKLFCRAVRLGAFIHDFGKANNHFQRAVRSNRYLEQGIRHEALSAILCTQEPTLRKWLCPDTESDTTLVFRAAVLAAVGHHLKTNKDANAKADPKELIIYLNRDDFRELAKLGINRLGLSTLEEFSGPWELNFDYDDCEDVSEWVLELERLFREEAEEWCKEADDETMVWLAAVKAMVVSADVAGSAIPTADWQVEQRVSIKDWIGGALREAATGEELSQIVAERLEGIELNQAREEFQRQVEESQTRVTLVKAGCGAGKTVAAYRWAARRAAGRKLFFCYPTTGTASQGFKDYVSKSKTEGALIHSRSAVDLEKIQSTPDDEWDEDGKETTDLRIESLQAWEPPLVVCTVDAVLGLMQNNRRGLYSFPSFANAAFVFDEIHAYDPLLFDALLRFLKTFRDAPVMLMTASLPTAMQTTLEQVCGKLEPYFGPRKRERAKRYQLEFIRDDPDAMAWEAVEEILLNGGKVLWIVNTVDRAIELYGDKVGAKTRSSIYDALTGSFRLPVYLYHGRFRYAERVDKQDGMVAAFKGKVAVLAITTQVAEMSLDLSADLLITDIAPPAALIQRLGRLNRDDDEPTKIKRALILDRPDAIPYTEPGGKEPSPEFTLAYKWLERLKLGFASLSQQQLARALKKVSINTDVDSYSAEHSHWLDDLWRSQIGPLRGGEGTVPVVWRPDVAKIKRAGDDLVGNKHWRALTEEERAVKRRAMKDEAIRRSFSIPARPAVNGWVKLEQHKLFRIAESEDLEYNEETGAQWRTKNRH